ncbi:hypothetical protein LguiA_005860 [Lonicera macranthoides]
MLESTIALYSLYSSYFLLLLLLLLLLHVVVICMIPAIKFIKAFQLFLLEMDLLKSTVGSEVGLRLLLCPLNSNIVTRAACCTVGIVLPVYSTLRAIERKDQHQQHKWLLYWAGKPGCHFPTPVDLVYARFRPYYYFKFAFLVWLQLPNVDGARQLYTSHLRPFFLKHQAICDQVMGLTYVQLVLPLSSAFYYFIAYLKFCWSIHNGVHSIKDVELKTCWVFANTQVKFISAHQAEIAFIKAMVMEVFSPDKTSEPPAHNEMEGHTRAASDTESDLDD